MNEGVFLHPIKVVALRTGLSPHLIRVWERRYGAVTPGRSDTHRRLYSEGEIERLKLLQALTESGQSIGRIANLSIGQLRELAANARSQPQSSAIEDRRGERRSIGRVHVDRCLRAVADLDQPGLERALQEGAVALGQQGVLLHVVAPLAEEVGALWQDGTIGVAHEHFASAILRTFLGNMSRPFAPNENAPHIMVATPSGQLHELGALIVTAAAVALGWQATYLGACLSAMEIASALKQKPARAVGLSIVYPADDPALPGELRRLRSLLPADTALLVGGRGAANHQELLTEIGAIHSGGPLTNFMERLQELRAGKS